MQTAASASNFLTHQPSAMVASASPGRSRPTIQTMPLSAIASTSSVVPMVVEAHTMGTGKPHVPQKVIGKERGWNKKHISHDKKSGKYIKCSKSTADAKESDAEVYKPM